jgi:hypothetical protein
MSTIKLNSSNDVYFDEFGKIVFISGINSDEEIKQRLQIKLKTFKGEWFLDTEHGVPYFFDILGTKNIDLNILESFLKSAILEVDGVKQIIQSNIDYKPKERQLIYNFQASTINNTSITLEAII